MTGVNFKLISWIFGISLLVWLVSNTAWIFLGSPVYYIGVAFMIFGSCLSLHLMKILPRWLTTIGFLISLNNLIDELFFDPTEINFNEYFVFGTAIIFICIRKNKLKTDKYWVK